MPVVNPFWPRHVGDNAVDPLRIYYTNSAKNTALFPLYFLLLPLGTISRYSSYSERCKEQIKTEVGLGTHGSKGFPTVMQAGRQAVRQEGYTNIYRIIKLNLLSVAWMEMWLTFTL